MELANGGNLEEYLVLGEEVSVAERRRSRSTSKNLASLRQERIDAYEYGGVSLDLDGKRVRYLKDIEIKSFLKDITQGLLHLHAHSIIHRDLKPPNLLLSFDDSIPRIMISDFGECQLIDALNIRTGATGTLEFLAPEMLRKDTGGDWLPSSSTKGDVWSLGVVLYFLCYSRVPYKSVLVDDLKREIIEFDVDRLEFHECERIDQQVIDLIKMLIAYDSARRPSIEEVVKIVKNFQPKLNSRSRTRSINISSHVSNSLSKPVECTSMVRCHSPGEDFKSMVKISSPVLPVIDHISQSPTAIVQNCTNLYKSTELSPFLDKDLENNYSTLDDGVVIGSRAELSLMFLPLLPILLFDSPQKALTLASCVVGFVGILFHTYWKLFAISWIMFLLMFKFIYGL